MWGIKKGCFMLKKGGGGEKWKQFMSRLFPFKVLVWSKSDFRGFCYGAWMGLPQLSSYRHQFIFMPKKSAWHQFCYSRTKSSASSLQLGEKLVHMKDLEDDLWQWCHMNSSSLCSKWPQTLASTGSHTAPRDMQTYWLVRTLNWPGFLMSLFIVVYFY